MYNVNVIYIDGFIENFLATDSGDLQEILDDLLFDIDDIEDIHVSKVMH